MTPQSYSFGYNSADEFGTRIQRHESSDVNNVRTGSYGYSDANGIYRHVNYVADGAGFRAAVETNEPGTQGGHTAGVHYNAAPVAAPAPVVAGVAPVVAASPYRAALPAPRVAGPAPYRAAIPPAGAVPAAYPYAKPAIPAPLYAAPPRYAAPLAAAPAPYGPRYL